MGSHSICCQTEHSKRLSKRVSFLLHLSGTRATPLHEAASAPPSIRTLPVRSLRCSGVSLSTMGRLSGVTVKASQWSSPIRYSFDQSLQESSPLSRRWIASILWWSVSLGLRPSRTPRALARSRPSLVRERINSRSNSASPTRTVEQERLIERAAALQGRTVTDFVLTSVQDAARRAIEEHQILDLSLQDSQAFVQALIEPTPVNDRLRDTIRRYRQRAGV